MSYRLEIDPEESQDHPPPRRGWAPRPTVAVAALAAVILIGGSWTLYRLTGSHGTPGAVPVIHADDRPIKVRPTNPGGMRIPDQNMYVLNGDHVVDPKVEQLLPPPEAPLPRPEPTQPPGPAEAAPQGGQGAVVPPAAPAPAPAPAVSPPPAPAAKAPAPAPTAKVAPPPEHPPSPVVAAPASRTPAATGGYRLQVGAVRSADVAKQEWERLRHAHPDLLGSLGFTTARVDLGARGVFYRILAGPIPDEARAERTCNDLKRRNVGCILVKP